MRRITLSSDPLADDLPDELKEANLPTFTMDQPQLSQTEAVEPDWYHVFPGLNPQGTVLGSPPPAYEPEFSMEEFLTSATPLQVERYRRPGVLGGEILLVLLLILILFLL
ncbi:MAG: hypothetical protein GX030_10165 [Firmicutes bacterium]|nr:hypothetical protein [Bacillota bacterium]